MSKDKKEAVTAPDDAEQQNGQQAEATTGKNQKPKVEAKSGTSALKAVGLAACKRHGLAEVWVTSDGQAFSIEGDAKSHARNLGDKTTLKVTAK